MIYISQTDIAWVIGIMPFEVALGSIVNAGNKCFAFVFIFDFEKLHFITGVYDCRQNTLYIINTMQSDQQSMQIYGYGITGIINWLRTDLIVSNKLMIVVNIRVIKQINRYIYDLLVVKNYKAFFQELIEDQASSRWRNSAFELRRD